MRRFRLRGLGITYWSGALALALVTGAFVTSVVRDAEAQAARYGSLRRVPVARHALAPGAVVRAGDITARMVPLAFLPRSPIATAPVGKTVVVPIAAGEVVLATKLAPDGLRGVAALLRPGERAVAVPIGPGTPPLSIGDQVDLLATERDEASTVVVAHRARIVGVDERAVTVAVRATDAPAVATALAATAITLALAAP